MLRCGCVADMLCIPAILCMCVIPQNWYSPLLVACLAGERCKDAVEVLLDAGADPNGHNRVRFHVVMTV